MDEEGWRDFVTSRGAIVHHETVESWITSPPLSGLGASVDLLERVLGDDPVATNLLTKAMRRPAHVHSDVDNIHIRPTGTSRLAGHRKLAKHRPDLHAKVLSGEMTVHAALTEGGLRSRYQSVSMMNAEAAANTLRAYMPPELLAELIEKLQEPSRGDYVRSRKVIRIDH